LAVCGVNSSFSLSPWNIENKIGAILWSDKTGFLSPLRLGCGKKLPMKYFLLSLFLAMSLHAGDIQVFFSPKGGCTDAVVENLNKAKSTVLVQAYSFTSAPIAKALVDASKRGVKIEVILDKSNRTGKYSAADFVAHAHIPTFIDARHAIAHNKIIIIDTDTVLTGSFNFTKAAEENNAENLLVIHDPALAAKYTANWKAHLKHSDAYQGR
jgi:phosphatidylserine/phosphatidylglycerophosphate/cardiolipin synthase-like enzyme